MKITLLTVGKLKESYLKEAVLEYSKRLRRYIKLEIIEVADEGVKEGSCGLDILNLKNIEAQKLLKYINKNAINISLAIEGKMFSSNELSDFISEKVLYGDSHFCFIIGGSYGLSDEILTMSKYKLSFSKMTFPHQLMRVILLEQIYRSMKIINNEPYHK